MWYTAELEAEDANLGHTALDEEHAMILRHIDELRNAIAAKLPAHDQRFLLHEFEMELRENCRSEERMMEADEFPDLLRHCGAHKSLYRVLNRLESTVINGDSEATLDELRNVRETLLDHVLLEDARIARWHRLQNISPNSPD